MWYSFSTSKKEIDMRLPILIVLMILNTYSFVILGVDKRKSIKNTYRISEKKLLQSAVTFGSLGFLFSMYLFRHKTKKIKFIFWGWFLLILQTGILFYLFIL
jgi:uncharacterized membrane protein YsdA (DUF1294 family)